MCTIAISALDLFSRIAMVRRSKLALAAPAVDAVLVGAIADEPPLPPSRPPELRAPGEAPAEPSPPDSKSAPASVCLAKLTAGGVSAEAAPAPVASVEGCGIDAPVRLSSITVAGGDVVALPDRPLLDCEFASVLADYVRLIVAPSGRRCCTPRSSRSKPAPVKSAGRRTASSAPRSATMATGLARAPARGVSRRNCWIGRNQSEIVVV
jgi:hypothetical protein